MPSAKRTLEALEKGKPGQIKCLIGLTSSVVYKDTLKKIVRIEISHPLIHAPYVKGITGRPTAPEDEGPLIKLKDFASFPYLRQYPLRLEAQQGFQKIVKDLKAQDLVKYLGLKLSEGIRALSEECIQPILAYPLPKTLKQLIGFPGTTGFCRIWIPRYGEITKPLYTLIKETQQATTHFVEWTPEVAFQALKKGLTQAPVLSLPAGQDFSLYVTEKTGIALGVLTQVRGTSLQPVAYLSKEIDVVAKGWSHCLWVVAAVAVVVSEAVKIIQGRDLTVWTSHDVNGILTAKGDLWLSDNHLLKYQALLLEGPVLRLHTCATLNPATFLPDNEEKIEHNCQQVIAQTYATRGDLLEVPLTDPDLILYTDGSSFVEKGL
nr:uncharacterized protein LOC129485736 [Symphalangus syndactylus]